MQELTYNRTALDARGLTNLSGGNRRHLWAVSGFEVADGTIISIMATCFDSTIWVGRCRAAEVVDQLAEDLGAVLTEQELLDFMQEALATPPTPPTTIPAANHNAQPQPQQQQPSQLLRQPSQQRTHPAINGGGSQPSQGYRQPQPRAALQQLLQPSQPQQPVQPPPPALTLHLPLPPQPPGAGPEERWTGRGTAGDEGVAGGVTGGVWDGDTDGGGEGGDSGAFVRVLLPPSRFDGSEVTVRLPPRGGMAQVSGLEAQDACLTVAANLSQQLDEQRDDLDSLVSELSRVAEENRLLRAQLAAGGAGGSGGAAEGLTFRDQYGLAGAPPPPSGAAAKRQRNAGGAGGLLQLHMQLQTAASAAAGECGGGGGAVAFLSQPYSQSQLVPPFAGALSSQASLGGGGGGARPWLQNQSVATAAAAPPLLPPPSQLAMGRAASRAAGLGLGHGALNEAVVGRAGAVVATCEGGLIMSRQAPAVAVPAVAVPAVGGSAGQVLVGTAAWGDAEFVPEPGVEAVQPKQSVQGLSQKQSQQHQAEEKGGRGSPEVEPQPAQRDPSRVGVTIRKTGPMGRGPLSRGGRGPPRR